MYITCLLRYNLHEDRLESIYLHHIYGMINASVARQKILIFNIYTMYDAEKPIVQPT